MQLVFDAKRLREALLASKKVGLNIFYSYKCNSGSFCCHCLEFVSRFCNVWLFAVLHWIFTPFLDVTGYRVCQSFSLIVTALTFAPLHYICH